MTPFIPFSLPDIGEEEISSVVGCLKSGWLTTGPKTKAFESEFSDFIGRGVESVAVNSATAGLHLALESIGIGPGDWVITTPYTFTATAEVVRYLGADVLFADIDSNTLNIDPEQVEKVIKAAQADGKKIKAIIPVHFAGLPCDMKSLIGIAHKYGIKVIEDAAHALPAIYEQKMIGTLDTTATIYSFYATKTITTGEGGMIVTKDKKIASRCRTMRLHGINRDVFDRYTSKKADWRYEVVAPGFKYNMTDIAAALGVVQLKKAWLFQKKRAHMAAVYDNSLVDLHVILPQRSKDGDIHSRHLYVLRIMDNAPVSRDRFIEMMKECGIGCSVHFIPLHIHPYWRDRYKLKQNDFPNAFKAYESAVSIPLYTKMSEADQERVIAAVRDILK